jgi:hypothetical protein
MNVHRSGRRLPGSLILFDPYAFVQQRQFAYRLSPSPLTALQILKDFTPTLEDLQSSTQLK